MASSTTSPQNATDSWGSLRGDAKAIEQLDTDLIWHPFPLDALPKVMADFAAEIGRTIQVDPAAAALPMLSVAGAAIGNTARARMSADYSAPSNIWTGIVQRSGERKSPVFRAVMRPNHEAQAEQAAAHAQIVAEHQADVERWKAKPKPDRGDAPFDARPFPHLYLADATTEAIAVRLAEQPRGLIVALDELAALFGGMNQYRAKGGNDRESYLAFYDAGPAKIDRKSATPPTIFIPRAFVSVCGMIQPGILAKALGPAEFASGMASRFIFASPPPIQATWTSDSISDGARDGWRDLIRSLLANPLPENPALIPPSDSAMSAWGKAHDRIEAMRYAERDDRMRAAMAKLIGAIPRMALIFQMVSAASGEKGAAVRVIDQTSMDRAIVIADWCLRETRRVYGLLADDEDDGDIIRMIEDRGGFISGRELAHKSRAFRSPGAAESFLEGLIRDGIGCWQWMPQGRGRPRGVFVLHTPGNGNTNGDGDSANGINVTVTTPSEKKIEGAA